MGRRFHANSTTWRRTIESGGAKLRLTRFEVVIALTLCCCLASESLAQFATPSTGGPCPSGPLPPGLHASVGGLVLDPTARRGQPGVTIVIENEFTGEQWERKTGPTGLFQVRNISPGCYRLSVNTRPFRPAVQEVVVPADPSQGDPEMMHVFASTATNSRTLYVSAAAIVLQLGTQEELTVTRERTMINSATEGSLGATFTRRDIEKLPLTNGRTLQSALEFVPGVVTTESTGTLAQFTAAGQRRFSNRLTIDGMEADLAVDLSASLGPAASGALPAAAISGGTQTLVPLAAVEEIKVHTTNAPSELARAPGANTAIITRAGSGRLTGSVFQDFRPHQLAASDWFANGGDQSLPKRENHLSDTGVSAGGPILANRVFFFATWEGQEFERRADVTVPVPSLSTRETAPAILRPLLDSFPVPNGGTIDPGLAEFGLAGFTHEFPAASALSVWTVRVDGNLSARHHVFARLNSGSSSGDALTRDDQLPRYSFTNTEATATRTMTMGFTSVLSSSMIHDVRANVSLHRGSLTASPAGYGHAQALSLADFVQPGASSADTFVFINLFPGPSGTLLSGQESTDATRQIQIVDTLSILKGRHEWRFGGDYLRLTASTTRPANQFSYRFASPINIAQSTSRLLTQDHLLPASVRIESWSAFAQDSFRFSPRLTLDYGVRYRVAPAPSSLTDTQPLLIEFETLPKFELLSRGLPLWNTSWTDVAPRVAMTWQMRTAAGRETTVQAGWNLTFDELANPGASAFGRGYPFVSERVLPSTVFPIPPDTLRAAFPGPLDQGDHSEYYSFPRNFRPPRTYAWHIGLEQALGAVQRLGLAYTGSSGRDLVYPYTDYVGESRPIVHAYSNAARSDSHGLLVEYVRRLPHGLEGHVAYSWRHTIDTDSGEPLDPQPPPDIVKPQQNRGSADFDRRHVLAGTVSYQLPPFRNGTIVHALSANWQLDLGVSLQSGGPFSVTLTRKLGSGAYTVRPDPVAGVEVWRSDPNVPQPQLNPHAFAIPNESRQGTLGRNTFRAPPVRQLDLALSRGISVRGHGTLRVRIDAFNVLNVANFGPQRHALDAPLFGQFYQTYADALGTGTLTYGGLTPLQQLGGPRAIQLGVRFDF
jgi:hypothetical protein